MYNPRLKDKHALVDLARYGTEARKSIHPDVLIGEHCVKCPPFREGDILDANATVNLIGDTLDCCEVFQTFDEEGQRIAERLDNLEQTQSENYTELSDKVDSLTETHEQDIARLDDKTDNLAQNIINQERVVDISKQSEVDGKTSYLVTKQDGSHDTIIVAKGDKGDQGESFSYEDFTPEQLEALKVKGDKGDKGTSITRVQQTTVAYNDRGVNVITIDLDDGSSSQIQIRNGAGGGDYSQVEQDLQAEIARATSAENALQNNINSVNSRVDHIVEDAPEALDTLLEIAEKLHDEEDAVAALTLEISQKYTKPATGIPSSDMSESVRASLSKADTALQQHQDISGKADLADLAMVATTGEYSDLLNKPVIPTVPTNVSAFTNDAGYLTEHQDISGKANVADLATVATSGSYNDLIDKPAIPSLDGYATEQWVQNQNYLTEHQDISGKADIADLSNVAFSGDYEDLSNTPTIPTVPTNVSAFTNDVGYLTQHQDISGKANISDLASVATSGNYNDLINKPTIPIVPTAVSAFTNDVGYLTEHQDISGKQDVISDLDAIRSGAQAGSTALQPSALNDYYNKTQVDNKLSEKQDNINDLATIRTGAGLGATALQPSALNNYYNKDQVDTKLGSKQDTISNLATIEAGAAKGATSLQPSDKGVANGVATLNENGIIPSSQLPSYVDDVLEYESSAEFPVTGESGKIYVDLLTNKIYRWGGSDYVEISESLALGETSSTAYAGNKGKATTDAFNTHAANTDIHVTAAKQAAWDAKSDFSGSYNDLTDKPTIPTVAQSDWNQTDTTAIDYIKNKPTIPVIPQLAAVATSGDYDDLTNKPTIPTVPTKYARKTDFSLDDLKSAVADGDLGKYGLKPGDQKTINGHTYVIAGLNPMKGTTTAYRVNANHVGLIVIPHVTQKWNESGNTYTGSDGRGAGYANSDLHYYLKNTLLPLVKGDLGATNLIAHSKIYSNAVNQNGYNKRGEASGCSSGWGLLTDQYISALSEVQVYGGTVWSSSGYDTGEACRQLDVFQKYSYTEIFGDEYPWLRDVVSATHAAIADNLGYANSNTASYAYYVAALILFH